VRLGSRIAVVDHVVDDRVLYDVVLLAGSPKRVTLRLIPDIAAESVIEAEGEMWTVADIRPSESGPTQLICIYAA
jgi:hypothetical protein